MNERQRWTVKVLLALVPIIALYGLVDYIYHPAYIRDFERFLRIIPNAAFWLLLAIIYNRKAHEDNALEAEVDVLLGPSNVGLSQSHLLPTS